MNTITKVCKICGEEKLLKSFYKNDHNKDGYFNSCDACERKKYFDNHEIRIQRNREYIKKLKRENRYKDLLLKQSEYQKKTKDRHNEANKRYRAENKDKIRIYSKSIVLTPEQKERRRIYKKWKRDNDLNYKISQNIRARIWCCLFVQKKGTKKYFSVKELVGCDYDYMNRYLESLWQEGMSWENYGEWEIDHIKPCASFDLINPEEQKKCFNWRNMQPLWRSDNRFKSNKLSA